MHGGVGQPRHDDARPVLVAELPGPSGQRHLLAEPRPVGGQHVAPDVVRVPPQRLSDVVQLAGRLTPSHLAPSGATGTRSAVPGQVTQALVGLGWSERTAAEAVATVAEDATPADRASVQALLRLTLAMLGPARKEPAGG